MATGVLIAQSDGWEEMDEILQILRSTHECKAELVRSGSYVTGGTGGMKQHVAGSVCRDSGVPPYPSFVSPPSLDLPLSLSTGTVAVFYSTCLRCVNSLVPPPLIG